VRRPLACEIVDFLELPSTIIAIGTQRSGAALPGHDGGASDCCEGNCHGFGGGAEAQPQKAAATLLYHLTAASALGCHGRIISSRDPAARLSLYQELAAIFEKAFAGLPSAPARPPPGTRLPELSDHEFSYFHPITVRANLK
jgi:hypothetical protein